MTIATYDNSPISEFLEYNFKWKVPRDYILHDTFKYSF